MVNTGGYGNDESSCTKRIRRNSLVKDHQEFVMKLKMIEEVHLCVCVCGIKVKLFRVRSQDIFFT